jgi:hypothetical protein
MMLTQVHKSSGLLLHYAQLMLAYTMGVYLSASSDLHTAFIFISKCLVISDAHLFDANIKIRSATRNKFDGLITNRFFNRFTQTYLNARREEALGEFRRYVHQDPT